jgi:hypothetical protein
VSNLFDATNKYRMEVLVETNNHRDRVKFLLELAASELRYRGIVHDESKLSGVELECLQALKEHEAIHGRAVFGTTQYDYIKNTLLAPMLESHYSKNSHHPEHYANGVDGMSLFDVIEMYFDWQAAAERSGHALDLEAGFAKYSFSPQLANIFRNTQAHFRS